MAQQTKEMSKAEFMAIVRSAKAVSPGVWWKDGWYYRVSSQLPQGRVRIILTAGACAC